MSEPSFSIIIPQLNKAKMTEECIDSVKNNTLLDHQIVLVDNGSEEKISDEYKKKVTYVGLPKNLNFAGGCNVGASHAENDVLCFLNNDIILRSGWDECVNFLLSDESHGIVAPKLLYPNGKIQHAGMHILSTSFNAPVFDHRYRHLDANDVRVNEIREYQSVTGACVFIRRGDFLAVGGFDDRYKNSYEDADLCFKVRFDLGKKAMYYPLASMTHLESITSSGAPYNEMPNKQLFFEKWATRIKEDRIHWDEVDAKFKE